MNHAEAATAEFESEIPSEGLESLFTAEYANLARTIARIVRDPSRAEELAVEVFLRCSVKSPRKIAGEHHLLYRTAVRLALDELRRRNRRARLHSFFSFRSATPNPEQDQIERERQARVGQVLDCLRRRDAELLLLRAEGMSYEELAAALSLHPASVGTLLSRAQRAFRKEYVKRYGHPA